MVTPFSRPPSILSPDDEPVASNGRDTAPSTGIAVDEDVGDEDFIEEDEIILDNAVECPACLQVTGHQILREKVKGKGIDYLVKCDECGNVQTVHIRPPPVMKIPFVLTEGPHSYMESIEIDADEMLELEDVFRHDEKLWSINQIEMTTGKMAKSAEAGLIARASALRADMVRVKITKTRGEDSTSDVLVVPAETKYTAGFLMDLDSETWRIRAIHTGNVRTLRGTVEAPEIKRMYLHEPPNPDYFEPRTPRERRQAWKEGRLGYNPDPILPKEITKKGVTPTNKRKKKRPRN